MTLLKRRRPSDIRDDRDEHPDGDGGPIHDELPFARSMRLTLVELLALDLSRCFCQGWADAHIGAWEHAFRAAEERLGPIEGPILVARVFAFMRALLRERRRGLRYLQVGCTRICLDEQDVMRVLQAAIDEDDSTLGSAVERLVDTPWPEHTYTLLAAKALGAACLAVGETTPPDAGGPRRPGRRLN